MKAFVGLLTVVMVGLLANPGADGRVNYDERSALEIDDGVFWDFTAQSVVDDDCQASSRIDGLIYFEDLPGCCRAYVLRNDTLFFRGYNVGRGEHVLTAAFLPVINTPLAVGSSLTNNYNGRGLYYADLRIVEQGIHSAQILARGRAQILPGDTIENVYLVREQFNLHREISPDGREFCSDTVPMQQTVVYRWLHQNDIMPLAVQVEQSAEGSNGILQQISNRLFVCESFSSQTDDDSEETEEPEQPDADAILQTLQSAEIQSANGELVLTFGTARAEFGVNIYLLDLSGNIYAQTGCVLKQNEANSAIMDTSSVPHGSYIVAVCYSENPELNHKIAVTL